MKIIDSMLKHAEWLQVTVLRECLYTHIGRDATATVIISERNIVIRFQKQAHHPLLMAAGFDREAKSVPWLGRRRLQLRFG